MKGVIGKAGAIRDRNETVGFGELAEAIGCEPWDVDLLLRSGRVPYTRVCDLVDGCRKIARADANKYLRKIGKPALTLVTPEKWR